MQFHFVCLCVQNFEGDIVYVVNTIWKIYIGKRMQTSSMKYFFHQRTLHAVITMIKQYSRKIFIFIRRSDFFSFFFSLCFKIFMVQDHFFLWSLYFCFTYDKYLKYIGNMKDIRRLSTIVITSLVYFWYT